jgi:glycosyltransferase involved in cell wall biosynthesis
MNILMLHSGSDLYGSGRILSAAARALIARGHSCHVVLPDHGPLEEHFGIAGATTSVRDLGILRRKHASIPGAIAVLWRMLTGVLAVWRLTRARRIDIIYSNTTAVLAGAIASRLARRPHLWHVHEIITAPARLARMMAWAFSHVIGGVVAVSQAVRYHFENAGGGVIPCIRVIHNGIDPAPFERGDPRKIRTRLGLAADTLVVGMIGRVHHWKGQGYFLQMAHAILRRHPETRFLMAGDVFPGYEHLYGDLADIKKDLGLESAVHDLGYCADTPDVLAAMDIFVLPSTLPDPLPTVVLEAMAASRPVVATAHGGSVEMVVHGVTGVHIPWDDHVTAVERMSPLLADADVRRRMGAAGHARVTAEFCLREFEERICELTEVLAGRGR